MITAAARGLLFVVALSWTSLAFAEVAVPPLSQHVTDTTATLSAEQKAKLEASLAAFEARKGSQLAVLMVPTTAPEAIEQYALRVAEQWKLGRKKIDDGAILIIAKDDRALRIEVGYGLEGVLNDAIAKRIISEFITPRFKQQDFAGGITEGVGQMMRVIDGETLPATEAPDRASDADPMSRAFPILIVVALALGGILRSGLGRLPGSIATGGVVAMVAWLIAGALSFAVMAGVAAAFLTLTGGMGLLGNAWVSRGGGSNNNNNGGFSGGGGTFGGGGASGKW